MTPSEPHIRPQVAHRGRRSPWRVLIAAAAALGLLSACTETYDQSSPEAVLASAQRMVSEGQASRLTELVYADSPEMRAMLRQFGGVLGALQVLAIEVRAAFPDEIEKLRRETEQAAKRGVATGLLNRMGGRNRRPPGDTDQREAFDRTIRGLFADPYAWIAENTGRLSIEPMSDDLAAVLMDGQPVLPPFGVVLRRDGDKWYVALPTNTPGVSRMLPKSREAYEVLGSLGDVFESMLLDLAADVRKRKVKSLDDLAHTAGEKAFVPAALVFIAYEKALAEERRAQRKAEQGG